MSSELSFVLVRGARVADTPSPSQVAPGVIADYETGPVDSKGLPATQGGDIDEKKALGQAVTVTTQTLAGPGHVTEIEGRDPTEVRSTPATGELALI